MERFYRFAGITFRISGEDTHMYQEDGILTPFRVTGPDYDHGLSFEILECLPAAEGTCVFADDHLRVLRSGDTQLSCMGQVQQSAEGAYMQIERCGKHSHVRVLRREVPDRIMPRLVMNALGAEHHVAAHGGFLLHASFIQWNGRAILFTAPSGTGKSTQAALWNRHRGAEQINGDRAVVMVRPEGVVACGIPFCGTSGIRKNGEFPVEAIVYLSQGPVSQVTRLTGLRAFRRVWEGCSVNVWDSEDMGRCTEAVMEAVRQVPVIHLSCTPDETAVAVLEKFLKEGR